MAQSNVRLTDPLAARMVAASKKLQYSTPSAFVRAAIEEKLDGRNGQQAEERIAATLDRLSQEIRRLGTALQAEFHCLTPWLVSSCSVCPNPQQRCVLRP